MKKALCLSLSLLFVLLLFAACGGASSSSAAVSIDNDAFTAKAESVLDVLNARDYDGVTALFREDLQGAVPASFWEEQIGPVLDTYGAFKEYTSAEVIPHTDKTYGQLYLVAVVSEYENHTVTWQVVLDPDENLAGISIINVK